ncbi:efflux RND transporter permease subunit [Vineibacter terrae]|uniref:efflux RND transporter permease subunit n=1 Tax=Vineibacter terrae TaxID=2586908 RepID=UPI002E32C897|nr:efflux RND transporter permease subunit [Vineibacter terrae]HEX2887280.1 efflux RND transporter permease subunit [Vineibacter terrae]
MRLPEISIRRPVFATVMSLALILLGLVSYQRLSVREYPNIDEPTLTVETTYRGASAEIVESQITQPLEESLYGIDGIDLMTSFSRAERSQITVKFRLSRNVDSAAADVRDRVSRVRSRLPTEIDEPVIAKVEADANPIIYIAFTSDTISQLDVTDYVDRFVKDQLQTIDGVSQLRIFGERTFAMRIWLDRVRMAAYRITTQDVENALRRQNLEVPSGRIESSAREFTILAETDLRTPQQFDNLILRENDGYLVRLKDVGRAEIEARDTRVISRYNGKPAVNVGVIKQSTANPLAVAKDVKARLPQILADLPDGISAEIAYDTTVFIDRSIANVFNTIGEAVVLVVLVIFVFLRTLRATIVPLVTIPVSLIGTFTMMLALGFSVNTLTLLAMVLAIGLVVDDAIVMLENIARYVEQGMEPFAAALKGSREIAFAVVAMTITLAAVYAPIAFQTGRTGRLFTEFALTLAGSVVVSGFVALTLSPMMCSLLLKHHSQHGRVYMFGERVLEAMNRGYRRLLGWTLAARPVVVVVGLAVAATAGLVFSILPQELAPTEDRGSVSNIGFAPEGSTIDYSLGYAVRLEDIYLRSGQFNRPQISENVDRLLVIVGFPDVTRILAFARMRPWEERTVKQQTVTELARPLTSRIPGILAFPVNPPSFGLRSTDKPVQVVLLTTQPYEVLDAATDQLLAVARTNSCLAALDTDLKLNKPDLRVRPDREKAAMLGVEVDTIGRTLETLMGGRQVTRFKREGKQYDVMVQVADADRVRPDQLNEIFVRARSGQMVPLATLISIQETVAPKELNHFNKLRASTVSANLAAGCALGDALAFMEKAASQLPPSIRIDYNGVSREFKISSKGLYELFLMALIFIFLVLAAQFESFIDPFIIMLTVPLTMTGALLALHFTGNTLNVYSQIGLVTLIGLITKHGILIVEFANQLQETGLSKLEAVKEAATLRLRPILMTTGAMVLGAIPLATATGAGGESRQAIGWVIVGGLTLGTVLTLFVVPTAYTYLARTRRPHEGTAGTAAPAGTAQPAK